MLSGEIKLRCISPFTNTVLVKISETFTCRSTSQYYKFILQPSQLFLVDIF